MSIPTGAAFAKALEEAGVISDLNSITRIVIDIQPGDAARVYVERIGDKRLLGAFKGQLGHMLAENAPKGVRYWVNMATELLDDTKAMKGFEKAGLRVVEIGPRRDIHSRMVLVEDGAAPAEMDGKEVELSFRLYGDDPAVIVERQVIA